MTKTRIELIRLALQHAENVGRVRSWTSYTPGDSRGRRWVVAIVGGEQRTFTTREVEAFILGMEAGRGAR